MTAARPSRATCCASSSIVQGHYGKLFEGDDPTGTAKLPALDYGAGPDDPRLLAAHRLRSASRSRPRSRGPCSDWITGDYRVFRNEATRTAFIEFVPGLIDGLAHAEEPDDAVAALRPISSARSSAAGG